MFNIFSKIKNLYMKVEDILVDYIGLEQQVAYDYAYVSGKIKHISTIPKKKFADQGLSELSDLASYVSGAISDFRIKFNNFLGKFNPENNDVGGLENKIQSSYVHTSNAQTQTILSRTPSFSNYTSAMSYLKNNSGDETKKAISILDGSSAWKWEKRAELFVNYINSGQKNDLDKNSLRAAVEKNSYLKKTHTKIYETLMENLK